MSYTAAVITVSDKGARGERRDTSGPALCALLQEAGYDVRHTVIIPDDWVRIHAELLRCADDLGIQLVLTTGGTGFSPRDVTPEATMAVVERPAPGITEAMRSASLRITPRGCLSRAAAGIRGQTLIVNLPGSEKAAVENLQAVLEPLAHGLEMLLGSGSADCAAPRKKTRPSLDTWLREAKALPEADKIGMYLTHNGVVRRTARAAVRDGQTDTPPVETMLFSYDQEKVEAAVSDTHHMPGIYKVQVWLNEGELAPGDDIMYVLVGGDTRPHTVEALEYLVGRIKSECVREEERFREA